MMKVAIFIPCYIDQFYPEIGIKMVAFFEKLKYDVFVSKKAFCCGQPAFNAGFHGKARNILKQFIQAYSNVDYIIIPSASCTGFLKNNVAHLLDFKNTNYNPIFVDTVNKVYEFAEFISTRVDILKLDISFPHKVAYHSSCATLRENKSYTSTLNVLSKIKNLTLVPFDYAETCCGFGGSFAEKFSDISISMAQHKLDMLKKTNVDYIVSNDSSCLMHLKSVSEKMNYDMKFLNIVELF